jgi:DNA polymerase V
MAKVKIISKTTVERDISNETAPIFTEQVAAGFPSPADDYLEGNLDLNEYLIKHPVATFFVRVTGDSMIGAGIHSGDRLIVDRALEATSGKVVIAVVNGELTVKKLVRRDGVIYLMPENDKYKPIEVKDEIDLEIWGVVTSVIHGLL